MLSLFRALLIAAFAVLLNAQSKTQVPAQKIQNLESFELIWKTLSQRYWDESMGGLDWKAIHDHYREEVEQSESIAAAREIMERMMRLLPSSHLAIIPGSLYRAKPSNPPSVTPENGAPGKRSEASPAPPGNDEKDADDESGTVGIRVGVIRDQVIVEEVEPNSPADKKAIHPGWAIKAVDGMPADRLFSSLGANHSKQPKLATQLVARIAGSWLKGPPGSRATVLFATPEGKSVSEQLTREAEPGDTVQFGNLPPEHVQADHRMLDNGVGYIRLNLFLDPVRVMPEIEKAVNEFRNAPGIVFDLRNNPGGIGVMAMGIAGWFVSEEGKQLGTMTSRDSTLNFVVNPRLDPYGGRLALVVNGGSASTSEILAQGLKDLGRAKIFGTRTAGAALPSNIIQLPDGDRFQYPDANYVSMNGRVLEGNGVEPDVVVTPTIEALSAGRDLPLEAAKKWCREKD